MKKIVVTGGSGFIGSNLVKYLIKRKYFVINIDKLSYSANSYNVKELKKNKNYIFFKANLNNKKVITKILNRYKPIGLFNLAAETHVDRSIDNPLPFINSNILGTYNLLEAIRKYFKNKKNFKMIHVSTDEVYGDVLKSNKRSSEHDRYNPSSPYSASKASADHLVSSYVRTFKLPIAISNCFNNYGPNQDPEKLIPKTIILANQNQKIPIYGTGKNIRDWIFVDDHCNAVSLALFKGKTGNSYNVSANNEIDNVTIVKKILNLMDKSEDLIEFVEDRPGHDFRYSMNSQKISDELGWKLESSFEKGLENTIQWYLDNPEIINNLSNTAMDPTPWKSSN